MTDQIIDCAKFDDTAAAWDRVVAASPEAWFWATRTAHLYRLKYLETVGTLLADRSFILLRDGKPIGLCPLVLRRDEGAIFANYLDAPLPAPIIVGDTPDRSSVEAALFDELERRVRESGAGMISIMLAPPGIGDDFRDRFATLVRSRTFVDTSYLAQYIEIVPDTLASVRERYKRNVRKFRESYDLAVLERDGIDPGLARTYMALHTKDAGRVVRTLPTYEAQVELARRGEGFWVQATNRAASRVAGMLLVSLYKNAAYDFSVAVDPDFADEQVSHLLKWKAIERLIELGVTHYELGRAALAPTYLWQPTAKNYGIAFFKDGWSRGRLKTVWTADKFYSRALFDRFWDDRRNALCKHFGF